MTHHEHQLNQKIDSSMTKFNTAVQHNIIINTSSSSLLAHTTRKFTHQLRTVFPIVATLKTRANRWRAHPDLGLVSVETVLRRSSHSWVHIIGRLRDKLTGPCGHTTRYISGPLKIPWITPNFWRSFINFSPSSSSYLAFSTAAGCSSKAEQASESLSRTSLLWWNCFSCPFSWTMELSQA